MKITVKKTVTAAMLVALTVSLSSFAIPIGASKSAPRLSGTFWAQEACWHSQEAWLARFYAASCTRKPIS